MLSISSPNRDDRPDDAIIDMLVLHYTDMESGEAAIARLCDRQAKVSAHYVVEEDGRLFQLVPEEDRAWHAGVSSWRGREGVNAHSIGIELINPGHSCGYRAFPEVQMQALIPLCQAIVKRHGIPARNVVAHSDIAPMRKTDPGELFDWAWLAREGVGLWPEVDPEANNEAITAPMLNAGKHGEEVHALQQQLAEYGYPITVDGDYGEETQAVAVAFQRHFRPADIDGVWDEDCKQRLDALLEQL